MKDNKGSGNKQNINRNANEKNMSGVTHKKRPEIRDNLDHRAGTEQNKKGGDVTHNQKNDKHKPSKER